MTVHAREKNGARKHGPFPNELPQHHHARSGADGDAVHLRLQSDRHIRRHAWAHPPHRRKPAVAVAVVSAAVVSGAAVSGAAVSGAAVGAAAASAAPELASASVWASPRPIYGGGYGGYPYGYSSYYDPGCYVVRRRVWTPYGWRIRRVHGLLKAISPPHIAGGAGLIRHHSSRRFRRPRGREAAWAKVGWQPGRALLAASAARRRD